ncbi:MAG: hypothetical protein ACREO4_16200 [Lysobacter sp.]
MNDSLQAKVSRLRQLIADAVPQPSTKTPEEEDAWRRYQSFAANQPYPAFDTSFRAVQVRTINRIASTYGWIGEIQRFLDDHAEAGISGLDDDQVTVLFDRMRTLEACVQDGCDPPDMPPAR